MSYSYLLLLLSFMIIRVKKFRILSFRASTSSRLWVLFGILSLIIRVMGDRVFTDVHWKMFTLIKAGFRSIKNCLIIDFSHKKMQHLFPEYMISGSDTLNLKHYKKVCIVVTLLISHFDFYFIYHSNIYI